MNCRSLPAVLVALLAALVLPTVASAQGQAQARACFVRVALTFDDGPSFYRPQTLAILRDKRVPATFFDVGLRVDANPQLARFEAAEGHVVLNHTYRHPMLIALGDADIRSAVLDGEAALSRAGVQLPYRIVRPPYGAIDGRVQAVLTSIGYRSVLWTGSNLWILWPGTSLDYDPSRTAAQIRDAVLFDTYFNGSIVLLHDGPIDSPAGAATVDALPQIIDAARQRGVCFGVIGRDGTVVAAPAPGGAGPIPQIINPVPYNPLVYPGTPPPPFVIEPQQQPTAVFSGG